MEDFTIARIVAICIIFAPHGAVGDKLVQSPITTKSSMHYGSYYKGPVCTPQSSILHPTSSDEVLKIVQEAIRIGTTIKAFGVLHSASDIICTDGIPVDMRGVTGMQLNDFDNSVTVGSGVNIFELAEFLKHKNRALKTIPGFGNITIGGAIGTGAHGSSLKFTSSLSEQVISLCIIDGLGSVRTISNSVELRGFRIHLGLLGIVLSVTLKTVPLYKVIAHNNVVSDNFLFDGSFMEVVRRTDQVSLHWFLSSEQVVVSNWTIVDRNTPGEAWTNDHVPSMYSSFNVLAKNGLDAVHLADVLTPRIAITALNWFQTITKATLLTNVSNFAPIYTYDGVNVSNPAVGYYHKMFAPICDDEGDLQCAWFRGPYNLTQLDNEFAVDIKKIPALVRRVKDIVKKYPAAFPFHGILLRFSAASNIYMSNSYGMETCHFEFHMPMAANPHVTASAGLAAYQTILQTIVFEFGGKSHWGKSGAVYQSTRNVALNMNAFARKSFLEMMEKFDPNGIFLNDFGKRLKGTGSKTNSDPEATRCALLDNCFCVSRSDCAAGQRCGYIKGYRNYSSCINPRVLPVNYELETPLLT